MNIDKTILSNHKQIFEISCVPMSVELVLKLLKRMPVDCFDLQKDNSKWGTSDWIEGGFSFKDIAFKRLFHQGRDDQFPLEDLFNTIEKELIDNKFVITTLEVIVNGLPNYHNFIIYDQLPNGEFRSVSKNGDKDDCVDNVRERITRMKGTDILIYTIKEPQS